jgi:6-phosphogluconolactonase/glucosamine-6-phosphate isomerase/deaminase
VQEKKLKVNYLKSSVELASKAAISLKNELSKESVLFLSSGGSSLDIIKHLKLSDTSNITLGVLDERITKNKNQTNFFNLKKQPIVDEEVKLIEFGKGFNRKKENLLLIAADYEKQIKDWVNMNPNGKIIITQGIGKDGHTAGIMPFPDNKEVFNMLFRGSNLFIGYETGKKNRFPLRVTATNTFLEKYVHKSIVYAIGKEKRIVIDEVLKNNKPVWEFPANIIHKINSVELFINQPVE